MRGLALVFVLAVVAGCSASRPPERFHSLLAGERSAAAPAAHPVYVDVVPVGVPAQVDHAQWAVRQPDDSLLLLEQERWAAPLRDELRGAVVERLASRWSAVDVRGVAAPAPLVWRVRIDVQRFESIPGREARLEATWSVSPLSSQRDLPTLVCRSTFAEAVAQADVPALAAAHRRAAARLADAIGERLAPLQRGELPGC